MRRTVRRAAVVATAAVLMATAACGGDDGGTGSGSDKPTLTLYNAQHEELLQEIAPGFTKETGIKVELRNGNDFELANQIVQEGAASPADVFLTENSPAMTLVDEQGPVRQARRRDPRAGAAAVLPRRRRLDRLRRPLDGAGLQPDKLTEAELPSSIMDLAEPEWKGRISFAPPAPTSRPSSAPSSSSKGEAAAETGSRASRPTPRSTRATTSC